MTERSYGRAIKEAGNEITIGTEKEDDREHRIRRADVPEAEKGTANGTATVTAMQNQTEIRVVTEIGKDASATDLQTIEILQKEAVAAIATDGKMMQRMVVAEAIPGRRSQPAQSSAPALSLHKKTRGP